MIFLRVILLVLLVYYNLTQFAECGYIIRGDKAYQIHKNKNEEAQKFVPKEVFSYALKENDDHNIEGRAEETTEPTTWDKIKQGVEQGFKVIYDETHCGFHKIKELVKHHEHEDGSDPCDKKRIEGVEKSTTLTLAENL
ncbi:hypothetical protein GWI33_013664 [Rhynchophorus ferrugineus]|uniref:Uncharacterized protein n=1 Tax=Rhynchophorus ferrugineus TaxID=354439 RepID=A0A834I7M9_RHYFE|nr:hypothetical protein GWI33_013664 [Rhynchophorus ferrugineus]